MKKFERLLKVVREQGGDGPHIGRPWCLPLADRVLVVAVCDRASEPDHAAARAAVGGSSATVCRVVQRLRPLLALEPGPAVDRGRHTVAVRDRTVGAFSRNYRLSVGR